MSCGAPNLLNYENTIKLPSSEDLNIDFNDIKLNLKLFNKYFEVNTLDETLNRRRNQFKTRTEHLQKRHEALHEKEIMLKERIISYEMYIKELAMKRDRSLRRIDDEKNFIQNKQTEITFLKQEIEQMQVDKIKLQKLILQYQPHLNLLTQIIDQTDRFHSIDEMIEKFDMLYASYQDILSTIQNSNEELNNVQRQLLLTIEKKNNKISFINNRIHELEQNLLEIQQRIEKIQTEIRSYQQISTEHFTEISSIQIAIESMFDLVKRYSKKKDLNPDESLFTKLKQIDTFISDLIYYVDYVNNKQKTNEQSTDYDYMKGKQRNSSDRIKSNIDENNRWRGPCELDRRAVLEKTIDRHKQQSYFSYKIRGEDNILYTIQIININNSNTSQPIETSSSTSMILRNKEKKNSSFRTSTSKLQGSIDTQPISSTTRSTRPNFNLNNSLYNNEKVPFPESDSTRRTSILTNKN